MHNEIGSEFWQIPTTHVCNYSFDGASWFISGRAALCAIIDEAKPKSVALPSWCCEAMIRPFSDKGLSVEFYPVHGSEQILSNISTEAILLMDYFGYTGYSHVPPDYKGVVIRDITHSLFSKNYNDADYYYGSLRKWAGFWTGGFAFGLKDAPNYGDDDFGYTVLREKSMCEKAKYIRGLISDKEYLKTFQEAENLLDRQKILPAAERDIVLAARLNWKAMKIRRRQNAAMLLNALADIAVFPEFNQEDCPLFVPVMVPNGKRDDLRRHLIKQDIYCPIHWPVSELHHLTCEAKEIYDNELSLVCDQRYSVEDMKREIAVIRMFLEKRSKC